MQRVCRRRRSSTTASSSIETIRAAIVSKCVSDEGIASTVRNKGLAVSQGQRLVRRDSQAINGLAEQTYSPRPVRCEWHWGELDRILPCDAEGYSQIDGTIKWLHIAMRGHFEQPVALKRLIGVLCE